MIGRDSQASALVIQPDDVEFTSAVKLDDALDLAFELIGA
jgi:hypothetical protein